MSPGDVVSLRRETVRICALRDARDQGPRHAAPYPVGAFGEADGHGILGVKVVQWALRSRERSKSGASST